MPNEILNPSDKTNSNLPDVTQMDTSQAADNILNFFERTNRGFHHPNIDPVALSVGPFDIRWYSLAYLVGIILGWLVIRHVNKKYNDNYLPPKAFDALPMWIVFSVILGGRLGYVLFYNLSYYMSNVADIIKVWHGGMSFHGALCGVIIGIFLFSKVHKLEYFKVTDLLAIVTPFGLFLGRIANFINKELVGKITYKPWGVLYEGETIPRHPSQLYQAFLEGIVLFGILYLALRLNALKEKGIISGLFLTCYGVFRFISEFYREPDKQIGYLYDIFSMGQMLCLPMIIAGVWIMVWASGRKVC